MNVVVKKTILFVLHLLCFFLNNILSFLFLLQTRQEETSLLRILRMVV